MASIDTSVAIPFSGKTNSRVNTKDDLRKFPSENSSVAIARGKTKQAKFEGLKARCAGVVRWGGKVKTNVLLTRKGFIRSSRIFS